MANILSKRNFMLILSVIALGMIITGCSDFMSPDKKPNLLFLWTDEQQAATFSAYGNNIIKTPNLNRLSGQSFVFQKCYVTQPVCSPSRSSVMTGFYPHTTGVTCNNIPLQDTFRCFPEILDDPDYKTAYMGKWHLGDEIFSQQGFDTWVSIEDGYIKFFSEGKDREARSDYHQWLLDKGYKPSHPEKNTFSRTFAASLPIEHCKPKFLEEMACKYLEAHKNDPFILYVNFLEPHMPFTGPLNDLHKPEEVKLPENFNDPLDENEPLSYRLYREYCIHKYGNNEDDFRQLIAKYWGLVSQVDRSVGAIFDKLESLGLADNTIVVYTSDHGDMMGAHHMVEKQVMFEESVRVPFMMRIPFISDEQTLIQRNVSQIDIVPTLLDLMGKEIPASLQGKSLVPLLKSEDLPEDYIFIEWNPYQNYRQHVKEDTQLAYEEEIKRAIASHTRIVISPDGWKLCLRDTDLSQLYNLKHDPFETTNLFTNPIYRNKVDSLVMKIKEWQKETGDRLDLSNVKTEY